MPHSANVFARSHARCLCLNLLQLQTVTLKIIRTLMLHVKVKK